MTNTSPTLNSAALAEKLAGYGIDIADAMERMLDNAELYKKLAMHYFDDTNYEALVADMKVGDYETAYTYAHTLKGASGNLSFKELHELATQICDALSSSDAETAHALMDPLGKAHRRSVRASCSGRIPPTSWEILCRSPSVSLKPSILKTETLSLSWSVLLLKRARAEWMCSCSPNRS